MIEWIQLNLLKKNYFLFSANKKHAENGSELSSRGLVESLENINRRPSGFVNRGADDRSSRSMSRTSSTSNLETIQEGHEPEEPEVYKLEDVKYPQMT